MIKESQVVEFKFIWFLKWEVPLIDVFKRVIPESISRISKLIEKLNTRKQLSRLENLPINIVKVRLVVQIVGSEALIMQPFIYFRFIFLAVT